MTLILNDEARIMKIKRRFAFSENNADVMGFLSKHKISLEFNIGSLINAINIYEDQENYQKIADFLASRDVFPCRATSKVEYSSREIDESEWLTIRSTWRNDYPQPADDFGYIHTTYDSSKYCEKCLKGLVQKDLFKIRKKPNFGSKNFLMINWIHDEFFVSNKVEAAFKENNVRGVDFYKVLNLSGKEMAETKQIYVNTYLKPGIKNESIEYELLCQLCSFKKYFQRLGYLYYDKSVFENLDVDMIKSSEKFGEITCCSKLFITQRVRKIIINNNLSRGLVFEPVILV